MMKGYHVTLKHLFTAVQYQGLKDKICQTFQSLISSESVNGKYKQIAKFIHTKKKCW